MLKHHHPLYNMWGETIRRCYRPNHPSYKNYGAKGITVCQRWRDDFYAFVEDMGPRPAGMRLGRRTATSNFEPGECMWAPRSKHSNNQSVSEKTPAMLAGYQTISRKLKGREMTPQHKQALGQGRDAYFARKQAEREPDTTR